MFPWNSFYQQFPGQNASEINDHDYDANPNSSNGQDQHDDIHDHDHHRVYSSLPYSSFPAIVEDDGMLLSHLLYSQEQLILAGNSTTPHTNFQAHTDEISVVSSNQSVLDHRHHHHINPTSHENPSKLPFSKKQRAKVLKDIIPLRSTGKKDRHSKISTAQGLRDRRMRLSLQIARKFFDLQDMLGFDKASKTIEWLISKSKTAIKELKAKQSCSSTSEGEVVSKTAKKLEDFDDDDDDDDDDRDESSIRMRKEKKKKKLHKVIARESRDKARERARERTREKILEKSRQSTAATTSTEDANNIDNTSTVDLGNLRANSSLKMVASSFDQDQLPRSDADQLLEYYSISGANSEDDFLGFPGNWEDNNMSDSSSQSQSFCRSTVANTKSGAIGNVRAQNPCSIFTTTLSFDSEEQKPTSSPFFPVTTAASNAARRQNPSSIFVTTSSGTHFEENPSSVFMAASTTGRNNAAEKQNPRPVFVTPSNIVHQEQNPSSNFFLGTTNIFCSLNF